MHNVLLLRCTARWIATVAAVVSTLLVTSLARAEDGPESIRRYLLTGVAQRADELRSGEFTASGERSANPESKNADGAGPLRARGAFDQGRGRFDFSEQGIVLLPESLPPSTMKTPIDAGDQVNGEPSVEVAPSAYRAATVETYLIRTPDRTAFWINGQPTVYVGGANLQVPASVRFFDVNALGLYGWLEFCRGLSANEILAAYGRRPKFSVEQISDGVWRLAFTSDSRFSSSRWEIDINAVNGFTPQASRLIETSKGDGTSQVKVESHVEWKEINGAWCPVHFEIHVGRPEQASFQRVVLDFTWNVVNEPVDERAFSWESFPIPEFVGTVDTSLPKPVVLREHYSNLNDEKPREAIGPVRPSLRKWLFIGNVVVVMGICVVWLWYSVRSRMRNRAGRR